MVTLTLREAIIQACLRALVAFCLFRDGSHDVGAIEAFGALVSIWFLHGTIWPTSERRNLRE